MGRLAGVDLRRAKLRSPSCREPVAHARCAAADHRLDLPVRGDGDRAGTGPGATFADTQPAGAEPIVHRAVRHRALYPKPRSRLCRDPSALSLGGRPGTRQRASRQLNIAVHADREIMSLSTRLGRRLLESDRTITTAESCTGGWIAKALTDVPGSSQWFGEGFVTYSNDAKVRSLGVSRAALARQGAVSAAVARAMAQGALRRTEAELAVAVTGIAGPDGAVPGQPV